jgi:Skp family chaperone for outer membrane proteins
MNNFKNKESASKKESRQFRKEYRKKFQKAKQRCFETAQTVSKSKTDIIPKTKA